MEHELLLGAAGLAFTTGGAAWAGVKLSLNGMRGNQKEMKETQLRMEGKLDRLGEQVQNNRAEIVQVQTRCSSLHGGHI